MNGTYLGQFEILQLLSTPTLAKMLVFLPAPKVAEIRTLLTADERKLVAARLKSEGFQQSAELVA